MNNKQNTRVEITTKGGYTVVFDDAIIEGAGYKASKSVSTGVNIVSQIIKDGVITDIVVPYYSVDHAEIRKSD